MTDIEIDENGDAASKKIPLWTMQRENVWLLPPLTHPDEVERGMPATIAVYDRFDPSGDGDIDTFDVSRQIIIDPFHTIPATVTEIDDPLNDARMFRARLEDRDAQEMWFMTRTWQGRTVLSGPHDDPADPPPFLVLFIGARIHEPYELLAKSGAYAAWPPVGPRLPSAADIVKQVMDPKTLAMIGAALAANMMSTKMFKSTKK